MTWKVPGQNYERRYDYTYDGMNRLVEGAYSHLPVMTPFPGIISSTGEEILSMGRSSPLSLIPVIDAPGDLVGPININATDRYTERIAYDKNSNITSLERYGMNNQRHYGLIDSLVITRNGNQLKTIEDYAEKDLTYTGASDFYDGLTNSTEYTYNANGALSKDMNRKIGYIGYDDLGHLRRILYHNGIANSIEYIYAADGTKLRTIHRGSGGLNAYVDSIDYVGNLILKNGQPEMYLFDGGYASFNNDTINGWHYYIQDYMGNNRMVVNSNGTVEQITHYYPYGGVIGDISTNESVQKYKFEGKELDRTFGLDNYDIQARQYFAMMPSWDRIDPLAEKYYGISPYAYCGGDPVNLGDYDGEKFDYSNMTEEQSKIYFETVDVAKEESSLFNKLYTLMEESPQVVYIRFGETTGEGNGGVPVPAQYSPLGSNESEIVINQNSSSITVGAISEEIMHAYQYENKNNYNGSFNFEFEAKVLKAAIASEMGGTSFPDEISFLREIKVGEYGNSSLPIDLDNTSFLKDYQKAANEYSTFNSKNNIGNSHYKVETKVQPYCLINLLK